jgi:hypothetical protein
MKITVTKTVEKGEVNFSVLGENELKYGRGVTGHTWEGWNPMHHAHFETIMYGEHTMPSPGETAYPVLSLADTAAERAEKIKTRLVAIRAWVQDCKAKDTAACGTATVEIPPTIEDLIAKIAELEAANCARVRDTKGRYVK